MYLSHSVQKTKQSSVVHTFVGFAMSCGCAIKVKGCGAIYENVPQDISTCTSSRPQFVWCNSIQCCQNLIYFFCKLLVYKHALAVGVQTCPMVDTQDIRH